MKLVFYWRPFHGVETPLCEPISSDENNVSPTSCLLMDDGGTGYVRSLSWIDQGLNTISLTIEERNVDVDWSREAWGAAISYDRTRIYSLYDDKCFELIDTISFQKLLTAWRDFITPPVNNDDTITIVVD